MKLNKKLLVVTISTLLLSGCNNVFSKHVKCDDESAMTLVQTVLKNNLNHILENELKDLINQGNIKDLDPAKLKLSAQSVQYTLMDSRTDFIDPNSTKTTCSIDLSIIIPTEIMKKSDEARNKVNGTSFETQASQLGIDYKDNKIDLVMKYILQPTDNSNKIIASVENTENVQKLIADTLTYAFLKPQIEKNIIKNIEANKVSQREAQNAQAIADQELNSTVESTPDEENYGE